MMAVHYQHHHTAIAQVINSVKIGQKGCDSASPLKGEFVKICCRYLYDVISSYKQAGGQFHKLFYAQCPSFAPYAELLATKKLLKNWA